jgi:hypothetical protein
MFDEVQLYPMVSVIEFILIRSIAPLWQGVYTDISPWTMQYCLGPIYRRSSAASAR